MDDKNIEGPGDSGAEVHQSANVSYEATFSK